MHFLCAIVGIFSHILCVNLSDSKLSQCCFVGFFHLCFTSLCYSGVMFFPASSTFVVNHICCELCKIVKLYGLSRTDKFV